MDKETKMMLNAILEEMARMQANLERRMDERFDAADRRFERIASELESLRHEVNACRLDKDAVQMLIKREDWLADRLEGQEARVVRLEGKNRNRQKKCEIG